MSRSSAFHRLALGSLALMGLGIVLRFLAEPLAKSDPGRWVLVGQLACWAQLAAVLLFLYNSGANRHRSGQPLEWPSLFVFASLGWLSVIATVEPYVFAMTHQLDPEASVLFIAKWMAPLREIQFLGFAAMMIFGVALTKFSSCLGFQSPDRRWGMAAFCLWMAGLVFRCYGWTVYFDAMMAPQSATLYRVGGLMLAMGAVAVVTSLRVFEPLTSANRSQKFIRAAFGWLTIAALMLISEPLHLSALGASFSHPFTGALRHAVTVGFISQMIMGVSLHVTARMNDLEERMLSPLWSVFWLLNLGNAARVGLELATDFAPRAFAPMGLTGFVELAGLAIWAVAVVRPMLAPRPQGAALAC